MVYIGNKKDPRRNKLGYYDPTAYDAVKNIAEEDERFHKLLYSIRNICDLAGYDLGERIVLIDRRNGRVWRAYLARIARVSDNLSEKEYNEEIERAIDEIVRYDFD